MPGKDMRYELVHGELYETIPPGAFHGAIAVVLAALIRDWLKQAGSGYVGVEVVSPGETATDVRENVRDLLAAGTSLVWVIYPRSREVIVHHPDGTAKAYRDTMVLASPEVLPGFSCTVAALFAA